MGILRVGESCWRTARADRVAFLVDAAAYFTALRSAIARAERSVVIVGWDVDSRTRLCPEDLPADGHPPTLLPFLNSVLAARPNLHVKVLGWDFSMIYTLEREVLPAYRFRWRGHRRLEFALDGAHPSGASHHQKLVVVDDRVAFVGGLDLTIRRWDTRKHTAHDPQRTDPKGIVYPPMHDVQMVVDGDAAAAVGDLARARWRAATGHDLHIPQPRKRVEAPRDPWPEGVQPAVAGVDVGIARTAPSLEGGQGVQEILAMNLSAIATARRTIFIENQYLTSGAIVGALAARLEENDGPEVVAILPRVECGWLEQSSMGVLRGRLLQRLRLADRHGRLHVYHPVVPGLASDACVNVHSKVLIVDDVFVKVGSSNLSNRSMALDTECDLAIEAPAALPPEGDVRGAIELFRNDLVAEHLGTTAAVVAALEAQHGSLARAIESLRGGPRSLEPLPPEDGRNAPVDLVAILDDVVCDPERPIEAESFVAEYLPDDLRTPTHRRLWTVLSLVVAVLAIAAAWKWTPLRELLVMSRLVEIGEFLRQSPLGPVYAVAAFVVGGLVVFPVTALIAGTALTFSPAIAFAVAMIGSLASATVTYGIGRLLRRTAIQRLWADKLGKLSDQVNRRGLTAIIVVRLLPVANFSIVNLLAGALNVGFKRYLIGSAIGLSPGILGMTFFAHQVGSTIREPRFENVALMVGALVLIIAAMGWVRRVLQRASAARPAEAAARGG